MGSCSIHPQPAQSEYKVPKNTLNMHIEFNIEDVLWRIQTLCAITTLEIIFFFFLCTSTESRWRVTFAIQMSAELWVCAGAMREGYSDLSGLSASAHTPLWIINHCSREKKIRTDYYKCFQSVLCALTSLKPPYNTISDVPNPILPINVDME